MFSSAKTMENFPRGELVQRRPARSLCSKSQDTKLAEDCYHLGMFINGEPCTEALSKMLTSSGQNKLRSKSVSTTTQNSSPASTKNSNGCDTEKELPISLTIKIAGICAQLSQLQQETESFKTEHGKLKHDLKKYIGISKDQANELVTIRNDLTNYKEKCEKLEKAAQAAYKRRQVAADEGKKDKDWKDSTDKQLSNLKDESEDIKDILGRHVAVCSNKGNYLEGRVNSQSKDITNLKHTSTDHSSAIEKLSEPSLKLLINVRSEVKQNRQAIRIIQADLETHASTIDTNIKSVQDSVSKVKNKVTLMEKSKVNRSELMSQIETHLPTSEVSDTGTETIQLDNLDRSAPDRETNAQSDNLGIPQPPEDKSIGTPRRQYNSIDQTDVPAQSGNYIIRNLAPVESVDRQAPSRSYHNYRNLTQQKIAKFYIGNIRGDIDFPIIWTFLERNDIYPIIVSLRPNNRKPGVQGAKVHIKAIDRKKLLDIKFPGTAYVRPWQRH